MIQPQPTSSGKYDARQLNPQQQALLRQMAVTRVLGGESVAKVTSAYGLGAKTLYKWLQVYRQGGHHQLLQCAQQGRRRQLLDDDIHRLVDFMLMTPGRYYTRGQLLQCALEQWQLGCSVTTLGRGLASQGLAVPSVIHPTGLGWQGAGSR